jgi:hypothetical protein
MAAESFPDAIDPGAVGAYPALVFAGGGYVSDPSSSTGCGCIRRFLASDAPANRLEILRGEAG